MAFYHPATDYDLASLKLFEDSLEYIQDRISDRSDVILNWWMVGAEPFGAEKRALLIERSDSAMAWVVGDGERFGTVVPVDPDDVADIIRRFGIRSSE